MITPELVPAVERCKKRVNAHHAVPNESHAAVAPATTAEDKKNHKAAPDTQAKVPEKSTAVCVPSPNSLRPTRPQSRATTMTSPHRATPPFTRKSHEMTRSKSLLILLPLRLRLSGRPGCRQTRKCGSKHTKTSFPFFKRYRQTFEIVPRHRIPKGTFVPKGVLTFTHATSRQGEVLGRKALIAYPGNWLNQADYYDPKQLATYTADRDAIRAMLALAVNTGSKLKHTMFRKYRYQTCVSTRTLHWQRRRVHATAASVRRY